MINMEKNMITHELISEEWEKDYPKPKDVRQNLSNMPGITLTFENKYNKYWDYYQQTERQLFRIKNKHKKLEAILKMYYSKKPLPDKIVEEYQLPRLQISYTKQEVDMMVKSDDRYCELESQINLMESLKERIKECIKFISSWKYNQRSFIDIYRLDNGYVRE